MIHETTQHDAFFSRIDPDDASLVWFEPNAQIRREILQFHPERAGRVYTNDETPREPFWRAVVSMPEGALPPALLACEPLEQLELPLWDIYVLRARPDAVHGLLQLANGGMRSLDVVLPGVTTLVCESAGMLKFAPHHLPAATEIAVRLDGPGKILRTLAAMPQLVALELADVKPKHELFAALAALPNLKFLRIASGTLTSLAGIERLAGLTDLHVHLRKLVNIGAINKLPKLERLTIWEAKKLDASNAVDGLARLKGLELFACGDVRLSPVDQDRLVEHVNHMDLGESAVEEWMAAREKAAKKAASKSGGR